MKNKSDNTFEPQTVKIEHFAEALELEIVDCGGKEEITFESVNVSRPGLFLSGYYKYFDHTRIEIIGNAEYSYLRGMEKNIRKDRLGQLFARNFPCLIISRNLPVMRDLLVEAKKYSCPIFRSKRNTTMLINELTIYQNDLLAPTTRMHGVLLDVSGMGILITGKSGLGKSDIALELINKGHRLVADDSVIVKNINDQLIGKAPDKIKYFMEIRGIGLINVQQMFGPGSIRPSKSIDIIIELQPWENGKSYDRIGDEESYTEILGIKKLKLVVPVTPGRNIPVIIEAAVRKYRLKQAGYDAAQDLISSVFDPKDAAK